MSNKAVVLKPWASCAAKAAPLSPGLVPAGARGAFPFPKQAGQGGTVPTSEPSHWWVHWGFTCEVQASTCAVLQGTLGQRRLTANTALCCKTLEEDRLQHALVCGGAVAAPR